MNFQIEFVDSVPDLINERTLYISILYSTAIHLCPCGCYEEVVTKIAPNRWRMTYDGESVSLFPSIGSWSLPCQSHYWIKKNKIIWADNWSAERIVKVRERERKNNKRFNK
ncbi:MAG: DUF6527 family protein [Melioribacteraceae bacterium]